MTAAGLFIALTWANVWWGVSGLNRRPTDYELTKRSARQPPLIV